MANGFWNRVLRVDLSTGKTWEEHPTDEFFRQHVGGRSFIAHYLAGRVTNAPGFRSFRTARLKMQTSKGHLEVGIDGEVRTMDVPLMVTTVPQSLLVRVPR